MSSVLPFDQRACFIAGQAKSGTTLMASLLDSHPELVVLPQETAYFPTVLTKYGQRGRQAQFDYLTKESFSRVLFGGQSKWREHRYTDFPQQKFLETFQRAAFDPANAKRVRDRQVPGLLIQYEQLVSDPSVSMKKVCDYLDATFNPEIVLKPTKIGLFWSGNSAARIDFSKISAEPATRWQRELSQDEI